jgi:glycosyltransferase involved in cell wall biosynthesis
LLRPEKINFVERRKKDYSRHNILKQVLAEVDLDSRLYLLLPFSKKKIFSLWLKRKAVINDFFISDYDTYANDRKKGSRFSINALYKYALDWINFRFSYYLLSDTRAHFDHWQKLFGRFRGEHLVFPVLADPSIYYPGEWRQPGDVPKILFYGYFIPLHGIEVILEALKRCEQKGMIFDAELIGEGQTLAAMLDLSEKLQLRQVVFNKAFIPEGELAERIRSSDLVLGIFGSSEKARSVVPNKVYQGLACRATVITQDSPAVREFFTDEDLCLVESDPNRLAEAIEALIQDPDRCRRLAEKGYASYKTLYADSVESLKAFVLSVDEKCSSKA